MTRFSISALALLLIGAPVMAQDKPAEEEKGPFSANIAAATDYTFRGISQTKNRGALQGTVEYAHASGFYVGAFASNVKFPDQTGTANDHTKYEVDLSAGYRFELGPISWDVGAIAYTYPGEGRHPVSPNTAASHTNYQYYEGQIKGTFEAIKDKLSFTAQYNRSQDYYADSGRSHYGNFSTKIGLPDEFNLGAAVGRSWIQRNDRFGAPDYYDWMIGLSHWVGVKDLVAEIRFVDTSVTKGGCAMPVNGTVCGPRGIFMLTYNF
ncbi:MAG: hypothetical protein FJX47_12415 [Alphaproteobacteria bacterium]|nr:hypothetical protein [Alphaproteobacteria bacterium]